MKRHNKGEAYASSDHGEYKSNDGVERRASSIKLLTTIQMAKPEKKGEQDILLRLNFLRGDFFDLGEDLRLSRARKLFFRGSIPWSQSTKSKKQESTRKGLTKGAHFPLNKRANIFAEVDVHASQKSPLTIATFERSSTLDFYLILLYPVST